MPSLSRAVAVLCAAPLLIAGTATAAIALPSSPTVAQFSVKPAYGPAGQMVTLTAKSGTTFASGDTVAFGGSTSAPTVSHVSASGSSAEVAVPSDATTGTVSVTDGVTTYTGPKFILQQPLDVTISSTRAHITFGKQITVSATASVPSLGTGRSVSGLKAQLLHRTPASGKWRQVGKVRTTGPKGAVKWTTAPSSNGRYEVHFKATQSYQATTTPQKAVTVNPKLHVNGFSTAQALTSTPITGTVAPGRISKVYLQKKNSKGAWTNIANAVPTHGTFTFTISPSSYKTIDYRVVDAASALHAKATSKTLHITVVHRTLEYGDTGSDVVALWRALRALHYDVGPKPTSYGWDLLHAVTAFQKVQGLDKTGDADAKTWARLSHPKVPHLKYPDVNPTGYAVEVNIEKQILLISKDGKIWRILDTSTAGGYYYTDSEGQTELAVTPRGHFTFQYKVTGTVTSKLGTLYYPSYFNDSGYAIHGEGDGNDGGEVPSYPASHGCVRITDSAVLRYYYKVFTVGTSVWIY